MYEKHLSIVVIVLVVIIILIVGYLIPGGFFQDDKVVNIKDIEVEKKEDTYIATVSFDTTTTFDLVLEYPSLGEGNTTTSIPIHSSDKSEGSISLLAPQPGEFVARAEVDGEVVEEYSEEITTLEG